jgi:hypothetical protein
MSNEIDLPPLVVRTGKSEFRLRCHAAAWSAEYGGIVKLDRRNSQNYPGLLMLSATGPDTAAKAVRATLYQCDVEAEFALAFGDTTERLARAQWDGKPVSYGAAVAKLAPGVIHLVAIARVSGIMPCLSDQHLWAELTGPRYTTPLLRPWTGWLKRAMIEAGQIVMAEAHNAATGILRTSQEELDELVSSGVRSGFLRMVA